MLVGFRVGIFLIVMTLYQPQALDRLPAAMAEEPNYAEDLVRPYTLPDVLAGPDAVPAQTISQWKTISRPHQLRQLEKFVYGKQLPAVVVQEVGSTRRSSLTLAGDVPAERIETRYTPRLKFKLDIGVKRSIEIARVLSEVLPSPSSAASPSTDQQASGEAVPESPARKVSMEKPEEHA